MFLINALASCRSIGYLLCLHLRYSKSLVTTVLNTSPDILSTAVTCRYAFKEKAVIDKDHGILPDASAEGPPFDTKTSCVKYFGV